jgi:U3 small nucleolar RNA-associated protein 22
MVAFATESAKVLQQHLEAAGMERQGGLPDVLQLFRTTLGDYDVLINLKPVALPRRDQKIDYKVGGGKGAKKYKNLALQDESTQAATEQKTVVSHDPAQLYLRDLRSAYGDAALFFYDKLGGDVIGVVWNPDALAPCAFKAQYARDAAPVTLPKVGKVWDKQIALNVSAVVEGFRTIGQGLVKSISIKD